MLHEIQYLVLRVILLIRVNWIYCGNYLFPLRVDWGLSKWMTWVSSGSRLCENSRIFWSIGTERHLA